MYEEMWWRKLLYVPLVLFSLPVLSLIWPFLLMIGIRKLASDYSSDALDFLAAISGVTLTAAWIIALLCWVGITGGANG